MTIDKSERIGQTTADQWNKQAEAPAPAPAQESTESLSREEQIEKIKEYYPNFNTVPLPDGVTLCEDNFNDPIKWYDECTEHVVTLFGYELTITEIPRDNTPWTQDNVEACVDNRTKHSPHTFCNMTQRYLDSDSARLASYRFHYNSPSKRAGMDEAAEERRKRFEKQKREIEKRSNAEAYNDYVESCQSRRAEIAKLKISIKELIVQRNQKVNEIKIKYDSEIIEHKSKILELQSSIKKFGQ